MSDSQIKLKEQNLRENEEKRSSLRETDDSEDEDGLGMGDMFPEPERPPPPPTTVASYTSPNTSFTYTISLVSLNPLWGHLLWNASLIISNYISTPSITDSIVRGKNVIEFGAGGGLPSLVTATSGAKRVVITDYPDQDLLDNLEKNVDVNREALGQDSEDRVIVKGHIWGKNPESLLSCLTTSIPPIPTASEPRFDILILSDLVFNYSQHLSLLKSMEALILRAPSSGPSQIPKYDIPLQSPLSTPSDLLDLHLSIPQSAPPSTPTSYGRALVFFTHHLPFHTSRDLGFFHLAVSRGWKWRLVLNDKVGVMFEEDVEKGPKEVRERVWGWEGWLEEGVDCGANEEKD